MLILLAACTPVSQNLPGEDTGPAPRTEAPTQAPPTSILHGTFEASEILSAIAWTDGWPYLQQEVYLFVFDVPGQWSLEGDFNDWNPSPMDCTQGYCLAEVTIDGDPSGMKYKFNQGDQHVPDPFARSYGYDEFGEVSYVRPPSTWRIDRWPAASGTDVQPRTLRVYVPEGAGPFPVLYAHDGQNLFDPEAIWGGWRMQDALSDHPALVVGIDNTPARFDDYTHVPDQLDQLGPDVIGGNGDAYADFVHGVVRPHIEERYATTDVAGQLGSSLGGLIALHIAQRHPGEYDFAASLSGTLGWGRFSDLGDAIESRWLDNDPGSVVYLSSGGDPGADGVCADPDGDGFPEDDPDSSDNYCENRQMADAMAAAGREWQVDLFHWYEPGAPHNEASWAGLVAQPLEIFTDL